MVATVDQMTQCTPLKRCLACDGDRLTLYLDLGYLPLANDFHDGTIELGEFPLAVQYCEQCWHSQLTHSVNPSLLFSDYQYLSGVSGELADHFVAFADAIEQVWPGRKLAVCDIAGNDGSLLSIFEQRGHDVLNVDPAVNLKPFNDAKGIPMLNEFWTADTYLALPDVYDVISAMNVLGHVPNPLAFLIGCRNALADGGRLYVQTSECEFAENCLWDTVYAEHVSFFTASSFQHLANRAGLNILHVEKPAIHGKSFLWTLSREGEADETVPKLFSYEASHFYYDPDTYLDFGMGARKTAAWLAQTVDLYGEAGYACVGYGAAAKGMALLRFAEVTLDCIADDNLLKQGLLTPGTDIPVVPVEHLAAIEEPLCCVVLAWNNLKEIKERVKAVRDHDDDVFVVCFPTPDVTK